MNYTAKGVITQVGYANIDIDGHKQKTVYFYIIPGQSDDVMLGLPWMDEQDVKLRISKQRMTIRKSGITVWQRKEGEKKRTLLTEQTASVFSAFVRRARKDKDIKVFSASLADIEKALQNKVKGDPKKLLPTHYKDLAYAFDRKAADKLPPHRPNVDHAIELTKDDTGKEQEIPWGPLYSMSREELIVLRKTLTELLDKNFIRISNSPAGAPVLFIKKPGGGLRFYIDYRKLNAIIRKDRYPLPLITETLRSLSKAKWFIKLDMIVAFYKIRIREGDE